MKQTISSCLTIIALPFLFMTSHGQTTAQQQIPNLFTGQLTRTVETEQRTVDIPTTELKGWNVSATNNLFPMKQHNETYRVGINNAYVQFPPFYSLAAYSGCIQHAAEDPLRIRAVSQSDNLALGYFQLRFGAQQNFATTMVVKLKSSFWGPEKSVAVIQALYNASGRFFTYKELGTRMEGISIGAEGVEGEFEPGFERVGIPTQTAANPLSAESFKFWVSYPKQATMGYQVLVYEMSTNTSVANGELIIGPHSHRARETVTQ